MKNAIYKKRIPSRTQKSIEYWIFDAEGYSKKIRPTQFKHIDIEDRTIDSTIELMNRLELSKYNFGVACDINKHKRLLSDKSASSVRELIKQYLYDRYKKRLKYI